jgi:GrpB-like predicted nucleotidyltransferase (UPF0157 family)
MQEERYISAPDTEAAHAGAAALFDRVRARLQAVLPTSVIIQHVGATAVPGCLTKGDLDIVVRVPDVDFAQVDSILQSMFSRNVGSVRLADFAAFEDPGSDPPLGVQLTTIGGTFDDFHRLVDVLRNEPDVLAQYNSLKRTYDGRPMDEYRAAKDRFLAAVLTPR